MRTEEEMFDLIFAIATSDERIRAVYMNGSRTNPNVNKDKYQDYDIVFVVTETGSFIADKGWINAFGEIAIVQEPDSNDLGWGIDHDFSKSYCWLMLFTDGNRVDLRIMVKTAALDDYLSDTLTILLLDKDSFLPEIPAASDNGHWLESPTKEKYRGCCNEFWWCLNNVAKGIARKHLPYAMRMYTEIVHNELEKMTEWYIGMKYEFSVSTGMWGKYFEKYLPSELYAMYEKTYPNGDYENFWAAIFAACDLFRIIAPKVGEYFNFEYNINEDIRMTDYLHRVEKGII